MKKNQKGFANLVIAFVVVLLVGSSIFFYINKKQKNQLVSADLPIVDPTTSLKPNAFIPTTPASQLRHLGGLNRYGEKASQYSVDEVHSYYDGKVINADPKTLDIVKGNLREMKGYIIYEYARDARMVYYGGIPLYGVNLSTFQPIENGSGNHSYGSDGQTVYFHFSPISKADPKTFKVLWKTMWEGCPQSHYSKDSAYVYFNNPMDGVSLFVTDADVATFEPLVKGFGKDKRGYYKGPTYLGPTIDLNELTCDVG